jgi:hypothetical protein
VGVGVLGLIGSAVVSLVADDAVSVWIPLLAVLCVIRGAGDVLRERHRGLTPLQWQIAMWGLLLVAAGFYGAALLTGLVGSGTGRERYGGLGMIIGAGIFVVGAIRHRDTLMPGSQDTAQQRDTESH